MRIIICGPIFCCVKQNPPLQIKVNKSFWNKGRIPWNFTQSFGISLLCQLRHICPPLDALLKLVRLGDSLSETYCAIMNIYRYLFCHKHICLLKFAGASWYGYKTWDQSLGTYAPTKSCDCCEKPTSIWGICRQKTKKTDFRSRMVSTIFVYFLKKTRDHNQKQLVHKHITLVLSINDM
jgi:hypothetical protein